MEIKNTKLLETLQFGAQQQGTTLQINNYRIDSRPEFNGELKLYATLCSIFSIQSVVIIGARDDFFYLQINPTAHHLLVEPSPDDSRRLESYIHSKAFDNILISESCAWSEAGLILQLYPGGTCFPVQSEEAYLRAINSGLVIDPYFVPGKSYIKNALDAKSFTSSTLDMICKEKSFLSAPDFLKIDIEGGEVFALKGYSAAATIPFVQYEYNTFWWNAGVSHAAMYQLLSGYHHYFVAPSGLIKIRDPFQTYFYANILASKLDLGNAVSFIL